MGVETPPKTEALQWFPRAAGVETGSLAHIENLQVGKAVIINILSSFFINIGQNTIIRHLFSNLFFIFLVDYWT